MILTPPSTPSNSTPPRFSIDAAINELPELMRGRGAGMKVYLVADRLTHDNLKGVFLHEVVVHYGLRDMLGDEPFAAVLDRMAALNRVGNKAVRDAYARVPKNTPAAMVDEEALGYLAERHADLPLIRGLIARLKAFLFRTFGVGGKNLNHDDMVALVKASAGRATAARHASRQGEAQPAFSRRAPFNASFSDFATESQSRKARNFAQARTAARAFQGKPLTNTASGIKATVSRKALDKMLSSSAVERSESGMAQAKAVANLDSLFASALHGWQKPDRDNDPNIAAVHRFFAPMDLDGRAMIAKMTVKETAVSNQANPLYSVQSVELNEKTPAATWVDAAARSDNGSARLQTLSAEAVYTLAQRVEDFNANDAYSQVADESQPAGAARRNAWDDGAADTTRALGQLFDANGNPLEGRPQHDRGEGLSQTIVAYPVTRAEADALGAYETLFRYSTRGPDTTGDQGWFVDADKALEALDRQASVGNAPTRGLETRLSDAQRQILRAAVQRERVEFGHDVTAKGDRRWYRVNRAGTQATPRTRWNEPLFSVDATMDGDEAAEPVDDAKAEALRRGGFLWATKTPTERMTASMAKRWEDFKTNVLGRWREGLFDQFAPIKAIEGDVSADQSAYLAARLSTGASSTMYASLLYGAPEWQNGIIGKKAGTRGLLSVMEPIKGEMNEWLGWMVAKRAEHLAGQDRENNLRAEDIRKLQEGVTGEKLARYEAVAAEFRAFNTDMLRMARDAGLLSEAQVQAFSKDAYYVPFYRQDESDIDADPTRPFTKRGLSHQDAGIKALKGGTEALADPLENVFANMQRLVDASLKNHAMRQTARDAPHLFEEEYKTPAGKKRYAAGDLSDPDVVRVMDNGQARYFRVADRALLRSVAGLNAGPIAGLGLFRTFKRMLTLGVTADPAFMMRNFARDMLAAWMMDKNGFKFATDSLRGAKDTLRSLRDHDNVDIGLQTMMFSGAPFVGGHGYGDDPESQANALRRALHAKGLTPDGVDIHMASIIDQLAKWWSAYRELGDAAENANRMAVYRAAKAAGKSEAEAVFEAKDLMDFSLHGSFKFMQVMSDMLPFFNARVQGVYKLGRAGSENTNQLAKRGLMVMGATLILAAANMGNDDYDDLPEWEKDLYWHLYMPGGAHLRIPKPFELGIMFGTVPERMLRAATGKDTHRESYKALIRNLGQVMAFDPTPQLFNPALETYMNYDKFRDAPIENIGDQGKLAGARYNSYTSPTMVEIGQALNVSPKKLEHLWGGYLGTLGSYVLGTSDFLVRKARGDIGPSLTLRDMPVVSAFVRGSSPNRSTKYAGEFYDLLNEANQVSSTINQYRESGQLEQAQDLLKSNRGLLGVRSSLSAAQRQAGDIRDRMDQVRASHSLSPETKRERLDNMQKMLNRMMKSTVETGRKAVNG